MPWFDWRSASTCLFESSPWLLACVPCGLTAPPKFSLLSCLLRLTLPNPAWADLRWWRSAYSSFFRTPSSPPYFTYWASCDLLAYEKL